MRKNLYCDFAHPCTKQNDDGAVNYLRDIYLSENAAGFWELFCKIFADEW